MMRNLMLVSFALVVLMLAGCGTNPRGTAMMTETQAFTELQQLPPLASQVESGAASAEGLSQILQDMIANGQIVIPNGNGQMAVATTPQLNIPLLDAILSFISGGQATNVWTLVQSILSAFSSMKPNDLVGNVHILGTVLAAALPILTTVAPAYAPIVSALVAILPSVEALLKWFFPS